MTRTQILQKLIKKHDLKRYLEIGVNFGVNIKSINVPYKVGVDPDKRSVGTTHYMTSDEYFENNNEMFDIIFVDGLHEWSQCYKDIVNSLDRLNRDGFIVCHDMNPPSFLHQQVPRMQKVWNGDVWKSWVKLRQEREDLSMFVVDTDWGCGIIHYGSQDKLKINSEINYQNFDKNRKLWLNLINVTEFDTWLKA